MYIIGTAGHIDHGKTSLIRSLTGVDTDRLPEEKSREMTIDIGFASIDYPKFGTVSVIDVPGHERFIRNMVVGAWGVDLGLLVIAADDGWMPQTDDHFHVLSLLGIERIVVALNKIDAVDEETAQLAEEEIRERLASTRFEGADIVRTSARTGEGIDRLKEALLENLRKLPRAADSGKPYLFVDRVFTAKGHGTIITGTQKNGRFHENDPVTVLPQKQEARIKKIESHFKGQEEGSQSQRTALNLSGIATDEIVRGHIVVRNNFFSESREILALIRLRHIKREIKNNLGVEIIIGTSSIKGKLILIGRDSEKELTFAARIRFDRTWFFYTGEPFILTHPGGFRIIGGGTVLLPDTSLIADRRALPSLIAGLEGSSREALTLLAVRSRGAVSRDDLAALFPDSQKASEKTVQDLIASKRAVAPGQIVFDAAYYDSSIGAIVSAIKSATGPNLTEIANISGVPAELCRILMPAVLEREPIVEKDGRFFAGSAITEEALTDRQKALVARARSLGAEGIELGSDAPASDKKDARDLIRLGFLVSLDGELIYHPDVYATLRKAVMALFDSRDRISIPEVRDATGLSRKYIIPLLNRMETDGLVKRIGDFRMKA